MTQTGRQVLLGYVHKEWGMVMSLHVYLHTEGSQTDGILDRKTQPVCRLLVRVGSEDRPI